MPIYNFTCPDCGHECRDKIVKSFDSELLCTKCMTPMVKGMSSGSSFVIDPAVPRGM